MKKFISKFCKKAIASIVEMSNLLAIAISFVLALFILWIPLEGKEMFYKNLFWNIWFGIYSVITLFRLITFSADPVSLNLGCFTTGVYFIICFAFSFIWCGIAGISSFGIVFFFTALPLDLIGRGILYSYYKKPNSHYFN